MQHTQGMHACSLGYINCFKMYKGEKVCYTHKSVHNQYVRQGLINKPANSSSSMDICSMLCCTELYFFRKAGQFLGISNSMRSDALDLHKVESYWITLTANKLFLLQIGLGDSKVNIISHCIPYNFTLILYYSHSSYKHLCSQVVRTKAIRKLYRKIM